MQTKEFIGVQWASVRRIADAVLTEINDEQLNYQPPGTANSAGVALMHILSAEDFFIHSLIQGQPRLWDKDGWAERVGVTLPQRGGSWDDFKRSTFSLSTIQPYAQAVRAAVDAYLANLTEAELNRTVTWRDNPTPIGSVLTTLFVHTTSHSGEIAAIRGVQGARGLPF